MAKGRRIFLMSPIHHHFQKKGITGSKNCNPVLDCWNFSCSINYCNIKNQVD